MKVVHPGPGCEAGVAKPTNPDLSARMDMHENARMTFHGRVPLVKRVREGSWRVADAAEAAGISIRAAYKWLARFRAGGGRLLHDLSSAPVQKPHATSAGTVLAVEAAWRPGTASMIHEMVAPHRTGTIRANLESALRRVP